MTYHTKYTLDAKVGDFFKVPFQPIEKIVDRIQQGDQQVVFICQPTSGGKQNVYWMPKEEEKELEGVEKIDDPQNDVYLVPSSKGDGKYKVTLDVRASEKVWLDVWSCTCKAGSFGKSCRHVAIAKNYRNRDMAITDEENPYIVEELEKGDSEMIKSRYYSERIGTYW